MSEALALAFDLSFEEAIAFAKARGVVLPDEFYNELQAEARSLAFTVSTIESVGTIQTILDSLNAAIAEGATFRDWQEAAGQAVDGLSDARQELVFRNAVQTAYGIGHTIRQRENKATRPYLMWDAINDGRTRPTHHEMDGFIAPVDDPVWTQHWHVPAGFNCRCARISLSDAQAHARGYPMPPRPVSPDPGFDGPDPVAGLGDQLDSLLDQRTALMPAAVRDAVERTRNNSTR